MWTFSSATEKRYWRYALLVWLAILTTLFIGRPLQVYLRDQNTQAVFFSLGLLLTGAAIISYGLQARPSKRELVVWLGLAAVYLMLIFRLGAPERSHLIEYSVLALFVHRALLERYAQKLPNWKTAGLAVLISATLGLIDEGLQWFLPNRVFDPEDIVFNSMATSFAVAASMLMYWAKNNYLTIRNDDSR